MSCEFILQLSKLRKSSAESVENTDAFDQYKKYLHVERYVEIELRKLLKKVNESQNKCLVLLCGSAGDGKSHLISRLKNADEEKLLENYEPYNDATESSEPTLTSIDTLAKKLVAFDDLHYDIEDGKKMIVAINLGTLNNFIESEKGKHFSKLRKYVEDHEIFSNYTQDVSFQEGSLFQHISFSDYQVFSLSENGIVTTFLEELFGKIFSSADNNPFYKAYKSYDSCPMSRRCPIRHNFEFLSEPKYQKAVIQRIVKAVIMNKTIVSTRDVLNLVFDLMVHPDFEQCKIGVGTSDVQFLNDYISWTTPMLLNEYEDISPLINVMKSHDILKIRSAEMDENTTRFHSLENIEDVFQSATENTPYDILNTVSNVSELGSKKQDLKKLIYKFIARLNAMDVADTKTITDSRFEEYLKYLYLQNSGNEKNLGPLYDSTKKAVLNWDGEFEEGFICIDDSNEKFWILEELKLRADINKSAVKIEGEVQRFAPVINLKYRKELDNTADPAIIRIDFALFELIANMRDGYRPTVQDKNHHTDFVSFVQQLIELGHKANRVIIIPKGSNKQYRMILEETDFGYEFKVVK